MKYQFFHIPSRDSGPQTEALNRFLATHGVIAVDREFVADGGNSFWALSICYRDGDVPAPTAATPRTDRPRKAKIDYREVLDARDFTVYAELRALRKEIADHEGVPVYALFTNEQLAEMVDVRGYFEHSVHGVGFCGYRILRGSLRLSPRRRRRYSQRRAAWEASWRDGVIDDLGLQRGYDAVRAITVHADSRGWRRGQLARFPAQEV